MALIRSFIAIPFAEALCRQVATLQQTLGREMPELRPVAAHNLHLTLNFLGDRSEEQLASIGRFMLSVVGSQAPFSLTLQGLGTFPGQRRPRVVWLGVQPPEPVVALQKKLAAGLAELGCPEERTPYRPHLTLGRFRRPPADSETLHKLRDIVVGPLPVASVILYSSRLTPQGAVHQPLTVAELKGR
jgi:2'-5' RNA ligase